METFAVEAGVTGIDVGMFGSGVAAVYLFDDAAPALVDAGSATGADAIVEGLAACGLEPADLSALVCSHVHADHSGAAGDLVAAAPDLDVYIHELTAPHLIDPTALIESSRRAMGEHFAAMGAPRPVPASNVVTVPDAGATIDLGATTLELIHAPGHSPDHLAVWNPERSLLFAAECLGLYLGAADRWIPPATLPHFDVDLVAAAIDRLRGLDPDRIVFPHFGVWPDDPEAAFDRAERELARFDDRILALYETHGRLAATTTAVADELLDLGDTYDPRVESFFASMLTEGYLRAHGLA